MPPSINPWYSMWWHPRQTLRSIFEDDPERSVALLAALAGFAGALGRGANNNMGAKWPLWVILLLAAIFGSLGGVFTLWWTGILVKWTGRWLGGLNDIRRIRAGLAWAQVLLVWTLPLWVLKLLLFGREYFLDDMNSLHSDPNLILVFVILTVVDVIISLWYIVVLAHSLGEAQGFSAWKGLANFILAWGVVLGPIILIVLLFHKPH